MPKLYSISIITAPKYIASPFNLCYNPINHSYHGITMLNLSDHSEIPERFTRIKEQDINGKITFICTRSEYSDSMSVGGEYRLVKLQLQARALPFPTQREDPVFRLTYDCGSGVTLKRSEWVRFTHTSTDYWLGLIPKHLLTDEELFMLKLTGDGSFLTGEDDAQ